MTFQKEEEEKASLKELTQDLQSYIAYKWPMKAGYKLLFLGKETVTWRSQVLCSK